MREKILTNVPDSELDNVVVDLKSEGGMVVKKTAPERNMAGHRDVSGLLGDRNVRRRQSNIPHGIPGP